MSRQEAKRLHIIHQAIDQKITQAEAAIIIDLSDRQIRRMIKRIRKEGDEGICRRSRGKTSNHRIPKKIKDKTLKLFREQYGDFNLVHATEKLLEVHGITINDETLRLWMNEAEIHYKKRRVKKHRRRRERKAHLGELVQIDGSHHDWFEGRGPICVFMGYIDDATNTVYGRFYDYEGTMPANSPQAKGRVERLFKTLQDRLVRDMRLAGIKSVEEANEFLKTYLPKHNRKFKKPAASDADLHRPAPHSRELDRILCIKEERTVKNDFTIPHNGTLYQIEQATRAEKVTVEERLDGTVHITYKGQELRYREITKKPTEVTPESPLLLREKKPWIPPADHPWKKSFLLRRKREQSLAAP